MRGINIGIGIVCMAVGMVSCKEDTGAVLPEEQQDGNVYVELSVGLSGSDGSSRSQTDTPDGSDYVTSDAGTEEGMEKENGISEILLVLADADTERNLASGLLEEASPIEGKGSHYAVPLPFRYLKGQTGRRVHVYVFCNPTVDLKALAEETPEGGLVSDFVDKVCTLTDAESDGVWADGRFLMSNARIYEATLPDDWSDYRSISRPFPLLDEAVAVERSVARFDYKAENPENIYGVDDAATDNSGIQIQLTDIALVNLNKSFYCLRRVADAGTRITQLCGVETRDNYVVDPSALEKSQYIVSGWPAKTDSYFYNLEQPDTWRWTSLSSLAQSDEDKYADVEGYRIWRYATENTVPNRGNQVNALSTGIVFKGRIMAGTGCDGALAKVIGEAKEPIYVHENKLYGSWAMVGEAASAAGAAQSLKGDYNAVENASEEDREEILAHVGFTVYRPVNGVYEMYYYYWNRHNDNGISDPADEDRMGVMEFAVVRNNVYKLSVSAITRFGHPAEDVPDPKDPDEPEPENEDPTYMLMTIKVHPWVTREYTIEIDQNN